MHRLKFEIFFKKILGVIFWGYFFSSLLGYGLRDPFNLPKKSANKKSREDIKLLGIIHNKIRIGAVLALGDETEMVFENDVFFGFKVLSIRPDSILLAKGKNRKTLRIE